MLGLAPYLELERHTLVRIEGTQGGELETHYEYDMKTERGSFLQTGIVVMWCVCVCVFFQKSFFSRENGLDFRFYESKQTTKPKDPNCTVIIEKASVETEFKF